MLLYPGTATDYCYQYIWPPYPHPDFVNLTNLNARSLQYFCSAVYECESNSEREGKYSSPMVLIGIYISIASLFCILAMALDLFNGFRNRKFWFPTKYFSLNAASITVIAVAMKLPVDLTSSMPTPMDQIGKLGSLAFMCTMMSNLMPSLASMDNKSLLANIIGLSILIITVIVNSFIQIKTHLIGDIDGLFMVVAGIYMGMLLFLLILSGLVFDHLLSDLQKISLGPRNPDLLQIKKWSRDMHSHDLTLIRASGRIQVVKEDKLLELGEYDLKDLLLLELEKDPADSEALQFELDFKGQVKDLLVRSLLKQN